MSNTAQKIVKLFSLVVGLPGAIRRLFGRGRLLYAIAYMLRTIWNYGFFAAFKELEFHLAEGAAFARWVDRFDTLDAKSRSQLKEKLVLLDPQPLISLLMPVYNSPEQWLREAIDSVRAQLYENWELCIVDDCSSEPHIRPLLESYAEEDARVRVVFRMQNGHISAASNDALALARGEFVGLIDHDDLIPSHALAIVALEIGLNPQVDLLYSDEDRIDLKGQRFAPYFKPDWNPDLLRSQNVVSHFGVYRTALVREVGGFRCGFEGSQDWDLALRVSDATDPSHIRHLPYILYHWRTVPGSTATGISAKSYVVEAGRRAVVDHLERQGTVADVIHHHNGQFRVHYALPSILPSVSLVIDVRSKNDAVALKKHLSGWLNTAGLPIQEVFVNSESAELVSLLSGGETLIQMPCGNSPGYRLHAAAQRASGQVLVFLSPKLSAVEEGWLAELIGNALRPGIGAVGARLIARKTNEVGGGYILGATNAAGTHQGRMGVSILGYNGGRASLQQNLSAISSDCLVVQRSQYLAVGGFDNAVFSERWHDIDLCLRFREMGLWNVWTPYATLMYSDIAESERQIISDDEALEARWGKWLAADPAYNPNLSLSYRLALPAQPRCLPFWDDGI